MNEILMRLIENSYNHDKNTLCVLALVVVADSFELKCRKSKKMANKRL